MYGGVATAVAAAALVAIGLVEGVPPDQQAGIGVSPACYNVARDGGTLTTTPTDSGTEAGVAIWRVTIAGHAASAPIGVRLFNGDLANQIASWTIATTGSWSQVIPLSLGYHKLIFRAVHKGKTSDAVRWVGLATGAPTWTAPSWSTEADGGARCWDAGCVPPGVIPRCVGNLIRCSDAGCQDALHPVLKDPIGCVRGCGSIDKVPDAGCSVGGCSTADSGAVVYRPLCCGVEPSAAGLLRTPAYSVSVAGLSSEIAAQVTAGSKVTVVSSSSADKNHDIMVYGIAGDGFPRYEAVRTNSSAGTTPVTGTLRWTTILGAREMATPAGTITMTSTTGGQTILTLTSAARTKGIRHVGSNQGSTVGQRVLRVRADDATTDPAGMIGGGDIFDGVTLAGTTEVSTTAQYHSLEYVAVGALSDALTLTIEADEGWCTGGTRNNQFVGANSRGGEVLLNINFAGIAEPGGGGCGARHVMVMVGENKNAWPPAARDAGYSFDAWRAATYPRWAYECRPRWGTSTTPTVSWNRDAGRAGTPYCSGAWCCVLAKVYRVPDGGAL